MEQPDVYKYEPHLIEWLKKDLERQRYEDIAENDLVLNIASLYKEITVDFDFILRYILKKLGINERDDSNRTICPYKVNAILVAFTIWANFNMSTFSGEADFNDSTFSVDANFYDSTFSVDANFSYSTFSVDANFYRSTFSGEITFYNIQFKENENKDEISIKFNNIKLGNNSYMTFENINFHFFKMKI